MDLNSLEAFLTVAELGSFSRAGERLFLTQPAISKRIANLESQLGTALFDRIGREVYLTEAGQMLQNRAQTLIDELRDIQSSVTQLTSNDIRQLNLASSHHIGLHYLGPILRRFVSNNPSAKLDVRFMESEQAVNALLKRDIEIALTTIPSPLHRDLQATTLWQDKLHFVVSKDHPLAGRKDRLRLNELAHLTAILPDRQTTTFQIIEKTFERHHIPLKRVMSVNYLETIRALVSHNLGWSLLPEVMLNENLTCLSIERVELSRNLGIIQHRRRTVSRGTRALIELAVEASQSPHTTSH
ncbi:LysR family transcriptional regulator [Reinekea blandensis]|uniref:Transcriptional regulator lysR family protein n=1 Tax=Reinekea blandensis MED297 TaxID=314283 RepID=A4BHD6_9GAMM|nr:LysR family transcriptional regulator [Reinekea blandensis]EAR08484.1 transcriptional regulator lysR family protein [Reinekea sp. MED297] [Reinekea blandensis MED297]